MAIHAPPMGCARPHLRNAGPERSARNAPVQREGDQPQGCQPRMGACSTHRTRPDPSTNNQQAHSSHAACRLLSHEPARTSACARARSLADNVTLAAGRWGSANTNMKGTSFSRTLTEAEDGVRSSCCAMHATRYTSTKQQNEATHAEEESVPYPILVRFDGA